MPLTAPHSLRAPLAWRSIRGATWAPFVAGLGVLAALLAFLGGKAVQVGWAARRKRKTADEPTDEPKSTDAENGESGDDGGTPETS